MAAGSMRDGHYLATYLTPPGLAALHGVWQRHDNNISLWEKRGSRVSLLQHWELERISGMKNHGIPFRSTEEAVEFVDGLLAPYELTMRDMAEVWGTPGLATTDDDRRMAGLPDLPYHSYAHLFSSVLSRTDLFFDAQIIGLAVDGAPDYVYPIGDQIYAGCVVRRGELHVFPVESPANLYFEAYQHFGLREGTLMALATATPHTVPVDLDPLLAAHRFDGRDVRRETAAALAYILEQVGRADAPEPGESGEFTAQELFISAVMKEVQRLTLLVMERNIDRILHDYGLDPRETHLALSGGYALNCPANSHLVRKYDFRGLVAPPCVNDSGQSIGIALGAFYQGSVGHRFEFDFPGAYLGRPDDDIDREIERHRDYIEDVSDFDPEVAVRDLQNHPIVWFSGRSEIGPRALGSRSLLADPTSNKHKDELNRLKRRQWWRPVAPVVLEDHLNDWFEDARPSPYMLETFLLRADRQERVPAIAHLDRSARVQSVNQAQNPLLHRLISAFHEHTDVPMLCNTSLNDKSEPIIDRTAEAMNFCLRRGVRVAYFDGRRVVFTRHEEFPADAPTPREFQPFVWPLPDSATTSARYNPHGVPDTFVIAYLRDAALRAAFAIEDEDDARSLCEHLSARFEQHPAEREAYVKRLQPPKYLTTEGRPVDRWIEKFGQQR
ncbi:carbamoyltransferase C-terminal domain-containing protein [Micromonospora echinospora]|uniref:carbamoyltransferase C-terminal domain-containing protein n=1 Tax=Micromonospora echinospora TaxID=1877 RepID=UPI003CEB53F8